MHQPVSQSGITPPDRQKICETIFALEQKHYTLNGYIDVLASSSFPNPDALNELRSRKLAIKDNLEAERRKLKLRVVN